MTTSTEITTRLDPLRAAAKFDAVLITDGQANLIGAAYAAQTSPATLDALMALAGRLATQQGDLQTSLATQETVFFDWEGHQVVGRLFEAGDQTHLLVVLAPRGKAYKQAVGKLIKAVQEEAPAPVQDKPAKRRSRR